MIGKWVPAPAAVLFVLTVALAHAEAPPRSGNAAFDRAIGLVREHFYDPAAIPGFDRRVAEELAALPPYASSTIPEEMLDAALDNALASLGASHTGHFEPGETAYYELADIFRFNFRRELARLFPPDGRVTYPGIGIASAMIEGKRFVTDVYDGSPAARAGMMAGDEILSADGAIFEEVASFRSRVGQTAKIDLRRQAGATRMTVEVPVALLQPSETLIRAISESARVTELDGKRIGYLRIWTFAGGDVTEAIEAALTGPLAEADALVVDLRGRWGGAPPDAAEIFLGGTPSFRFIERSGRGRLTNVRWKKPLVAIVDEGTRSGLEVIAYALQAKGAPLIGERTAGALLGGRGYLLPDDTLLEIAVAGVEVDGQILEGKGIEPDVTVPFDIRYAAGRDPQLDAAIKRATDVLAAEPPSAG